MPQEGTEPRVAPASLQQYLPGASVQWQDKRWQNFLSFSSTVSRVLQLPLQTSEVSDFLIFSPAGYRQLHHFPSVQLFPQGRS